MLYSTGVPCHQPRRAWWSVVSVLERARLLTSLHTLNRVRTSKHTCLSLATLDVSRKCPTQGQQRIDSKISSGVVVDHAECGCTMQSVAGACEKSSSGKAPATSEQARERKHYTHLNLCRRRSRRPSTTGSKICNRLRASVGCGACSTSLSWRGVGRRYVQNQKYKKKLSDNRRQLLKNVRRGREFNF